jgi:hypothetical protein
LQLVRATLELSLKHILADKKLEYDAYNRAVKDKEREMKNLKKLELQVRAYQDSLYNIKLQHEKIMNQVCFFFVSLILVAIIFIRILTIFSKFPKKAAAPPDDGTLFEKRKELTREVESMKRDLTKEVN